MKKDIIKNWGRSVFDGYVKYLSEDGKTNVHICPNAATYILFEKENIIAVFSQPESIIEFYSKEEELLAAFDVPKAEGGRGAYLDADVSVENGNIAIYFPIYEWIDNYPHCDGENDRWDTKTIGSKKLLFDANAKSITME